MTGLALKFSDNGEIELTAEVVTGDDCLVQNAVVNLLCQAGSDPVFANRGTDLQTDATQGVIFDSMSAQHSANFAALDTLTFMLQTEYPSQINNTIAGIQLTLTSIAVGSLGFNLSFSFSDGTTAGLIATV